MRQAAPAPLAALPGGRGRRGHDHGPVEITVRSAAKARRGRPSPRGDVAPSPACSSGLFHVREPDAPDAPPLVLLAGIGSSGVAWRPVVCAAARASARSGGSTSPGSAGSAAFAAGEPCGIDALADAAERFLDEAGLERPHVAGNSLGGAVGLELGRRGAVASVTALSPAGFAGRGRGAVRRGVARAHPLGRRRGCGRSRGGRSARPGLRRLLNAQMFAHPERLPPGEAYDDLLMLLEGRASTTRSPSSTATASPGALGVPATIGWGTRDALLLPNQALRARRLLPAARHVWLHGCGHVPMSDDPGQVARRCSLAAPERALRTRWSSASG